VESAWSRRPGLWYTAGLVFVVVLGLLLQQGPLGIAIRAGVYSVGAALLWKAARRGRIATGVVKEWHAEAGWGVLTSADVEGDVWAHFSAIEGTGFRELVDGDRVAFRFRRAHQDGYSYLALWVRLLD
jgi:CspA family cold shock protein